MTTAERVAGRMQQIRDAAKLVLRSANADADEAIPTKRSSRQLAKSLLAFFEIAMLERSREKQREVFSQLILDYLAESALPR